MRTPSLSLSLFLILVFLSGFVQLALVGCADGTLSGQAQHSLTPPPATPLYHPFASLLSQVVAVGPLYVTGDASVPHVALVEAGMIIFDMLEHRPDIGQRLRDHGAFLAVASRTEQICDLPYLRNVSRNACEKYGKGGAGGTLDHPVTVCDEQNLLGEPSDPYDRFDRSSGSVSQNICVHELAHTILNVGLTMREQQRIDSRYQAVEPTNVWAGDYAMTNAGEFWAVMSQFYFWAGPEQPYIPTFAHVPNGPDALRTYDPHTFALLDSIYHGSSNLR